MPEQGSRTLQFDVRCEELGRTQRLEMSNDCSAMELFADLQKDFGDEAMEGAAIMHWTTAEYDSPVDDVLTSDMHVALRNCRRKDDSLRKMCLIKMQGLKVQVQDDGQTQTQEVSLPTVPTFADVFSALKELGFKDQRVWYFTSTAGRLIGSSDWVQSSLFVCQLLHRDEMDQGQLTVCASSTKPSECCSVFARVLNDTIHELIVGLEMTVREVRHQLGARGGPWGEDTKWLYGGTLLENGNALQRYGIRNKDTIDIVLRLRDQGSTRPLMKREPVVVETEPDVDTACLIRKELTAAQIAAKQKQGQAIGVRGGTSLKGRCPQQFVEVDPIEVDDRFFVNLLVSLVPDDDIMLQTEEDDSDEEKSSKACVVM